MLKKTITYEDFNGETVTEDCFFHLSKAELVELELSQKGGMSDWLQNVIAAEDGKTIIAEFKNIILTAYGKRSDDGRRFIKNQQLRDEFESSEAYSTLFMELVMDTDKAIEFVNGIIPTGMAQEAAAVASRAEAKGISVVPKPEAKEPQIITKKDLLEMSQEEMEGLSARLQSGEAKLAET